jgi:alpha-beta hydrolase superfamily lysophospholipase
MVISSFVQRLRIVLATAIIVAAILSLWSKGSAPDFLDQPFAQLVASLLAGIVVALGVHALTSSARNDVTPDPRG